MSGGDWKPLVSDENPTGHVDFTADGQWFLYHATDSNGKRILSRVASAGGDQPERLGEFTMRISPDGSKVIVAAGEYVTAYEMWPLENFVPLAPKPKAPGYVIAEEQRWRGYFPLPPSTSAKMLRGCMGLPLSPSANRPCALRSQGRP
jgi:hypothetical protein